MTRPLIRLLVLNFELWVIVSFILLLHVNYAGSWLRLAKECWWYFGCVEESTVISWFSLPNPIKPYKDRNPSASQHFYSCFFQPSTSTFAVDFSNHQQQKCRLSIDHHYLPIVAIALLIIGIHWPLQPIKANTTMNHAIDQDQAVLITGSIQEPWVAIVIQAFH